MDRLHFHFHLSTLINASILGLFFAFAIINSFGTLLYIEDLYSVSSPFINSRLFTPAPYTFYIWPFICFLLLGFVINQTKAPLEGAGNLTTHHLRQVRVLFVYSCILNILIIIAWYIGQFLVFASLMLGLTILLSYICNITSRVFYYNNEKFFLRAPFSIFYGWITIMTFISIAGLLINKIPTSIGFDKIVFSVMVLLLIMIFAVTVVIKNKDPLYGITIIWAYGGILSNHLSPNVFDGKYYEVMFTTVACMVIVFTVSLLVNLTEELNR